MSLGKNADAVRLSVEGSVWSRELQQQVSRFPVQWLLQSALCRCRHLVRWGIAERVGVGPDRVSKLRSDLWPPQGSVSSPCVSSNETPFPSRRRGSSRPWWEAFSGGGRLHPRQRRPEAFPAPASSWAARWKEWSTEPGATKEILVRNNCEKCIMLRQFMAVNNRFTIWETTSMECNYIRSYSATERKQKWLFSGNHKKAPFIIGIIFRLEWKN